MKETSCGLSLSFLLRDRMIVEILNFLGQLLKPKTEVNKRYEVAG